MSNVERAAPRSRHVQLSWRFVSLAIVGVGMALVVGANAHLVYVAVVSQPECALDPRGSGEAVEFQAANPAC